jgi:hypothetical protein
MEISNQILCRKVSLLTASHFQFRGVGQDMKQTYLWYPLFQEATEPRVPNGQVET